MSLTTQSVKPKDFKNLNFRENNLDSPISVNLGIVASNIVRTCQRLDDKWSFTWADYWATRKGAALGIEEEYLKILVENEKMRLLSHKNGIYQVLDAFIQTFAEFLEMAA